MKDPFSKLSDLERNMRNVGNQASNPQAKAKQRAEQIKRQINQGTANLVGALCYVLGFPLLIIPFRDDWKKNPVIRYHSAHARVIWFATIISACTIIGLIIAVPLYLSGFYLASQAISGRRVHVPFLTQFVMSRGWA